MPLIRTLVAFLAVLAAATPAHSLDWTTNGAVSLSSGSYTVSQSAGSVVLTAIRNGGKKGVYTVTYKTLNGSATAPGNYTASTGTIKWADGDASAKTFTIPVSASNVFTGTKNFAIRLTPDANTMLGSHGSATVTVNGGKATTPTAPVVITKSIKQWVNCSETIDQSSQLAAAIAAAGNNAFKLIIDCPVRLHTGTAALSSIPVPDGVTIEFVGAGEFLMVSNGPPALMITHHDQVTFINYNQTFL